MTRVVPCPICDVIRWFVRYVSRDLVPALQEDIDGYHRFEQLIEQYVELMVEKTRAEREAGSKKKIPPLNSSWRKTKKSNS